MLAEEDTVCERARLGGEGARVELEADVEGVGDAGGNGWGMNGGTRMEERDRRFLAMFGSEKASGKWEVRERR